ncbi:hypothetical protein Fmac_019054 [Flemingia macrophylla]|uniref:PAS domain-containing protein n=1 Tax=Flemingia macrophylla TaxID=520843 RepID=A0ABD1M7E7_9FABA
MSGTLTGADWWNLMEEERVPNPSLPAHPIVFASPASLKLTGYARPEVLNRYAALLQGPFTSRSSLLQIREAIRAERTAQLVLLSYRKDGSPFWILLRVSPVFGPRSAAVVHFLAVQVPLLHHRPSSPIRDLSFRCCCHKEVLADSFSDFNCHSSFDQLLQEPGVRADCVYKQIGQGAIQRWDAPPNFRE